MRDVSADSVLKVHSREDKLGRRLTTRTPRSWYSRRDSPANRSVGVQGSRTQVPPTRSSERASVVVLTPVVENQRAQGVHVDRGVVVVLLLVPFLPANPDISGNGIRHRRSEAIEKPTSCRLK